LDNTDLEILKHLNRDSRIKKNKLAKLVNLTPPAVSTRIEQLEDEKVIKKYTIEVDLDKMGYHFQVFIQTKMDFRSNKKYLDFIESKTKFYPSSLQNIRTNELHDSRCISFQF
jgi:Transcriptional regulators